MTENSTAQNQLHNETSPYLLQHADNPVHWHPWNAAALARARDENRPILLSIGYSACHWCHVMAHESFEDPDTAELMNRHFINIKVDREERPDIDRIYQTAQQLLSGRTGGWPLTMFLMPDSHIPFFGGTYFPPQPRYGMPGFRDLLERIAGAYKEQGSEIATQNREFMQALQQISAAGNSGSDAAPDPRCIDNCIAQLQQSFDREYGGFGSAPKFPHPAGLEFLFGCRDIADSEDSPRGIVLNTLKKMAMGGIYDHLGGGFCRYSVDHKWQIPHFEKMLYDNGPLLGLYAHAWHLDTTGLFRQVAIETADWVIRDMQSPGGGYYSSLDADSEGEEGRFYVWAHEELKEHLSDSEYSLFTRYYGMTQPANFEGKWHLFMAETVPETTGSQGRERDTLPADLESARKKLLKVRSDRVWPGRDEKILTSWNALMIKGMAIAARRLQDDRYYDSAAAALAFIHAHLWNGDRLYATHKDGKSHLNAYLDDYAFLLDAILELLAVRWHTEWLDFARQLADVMLQQFQDEGHGGFYFTAHDHEQLLQRRKDFMDDALPSGNGVAASALCRLAHLDGNHDYLTAAERTFKSATAIMDRAPQACMAMLNALRDFQTPPASIILRGDLDTMKKWQEEISSQAPLQTACYLIPADLTGLPGLLAARKAIDGKTTAYVCRGFECREPALDPGVLLADLNEGT